MLLGKEVSKLLFSVDLSVLNLKELVKVTLNLIFIQRLVVVFAEDLDQLGLCPKQMLSLLVNVESHLLWVILFNYDSAFNQIRSRRKSTY